MIPPLINGHLPVGTYLCGLEEIEDVFVRSAQFATSTTRQRVFDGFVDYLHDWELVEEQLNVNLLKRIWMGGSFTSSEIEVGDIDISPLIDSNVLTAIRGRPGAGKVRELFQHRDRVRSTYHVEPYAVLWKPFTTLKLRNLDAEEYEYVATRGMMDDFWQRTRSLSVRQAMLEEDADAARGYLEVEL